ncbi:phosphatase PAP2 family protein [Spirosoma oryzicola]|uniref:phosphatase PAP2 family protein n=1 Tax=Spirosoma oryzicola TaxID=2898794 RepID=UPI001E60E10F|nr:phosphatase PAP2 family protein [Spirosoma oryzicola]UHG94750.1 phosphatase PAP2 family protein [Spirosoma oryzicola]
MKQSRCLSSSRLVWILSSWFFLLPLLTAVGQPLNRLSLPSQGDSMPARPASFHWVAPSVLIPVGLVLSPDYPNSHFDRFYIQSKIQAKIHFRTHADDFVQYGPAVAWAGLSVAGVKGRSHPLDRALIGLLAYGLSTGVTLGLKHTTHELRPDGSNSLSFPSGHTANAFTGARLLDREFSSVSPWIPLGGYAMASSTGLLRMTNDKHWISDILVGAGIGLLSTEVAYWVYPWVKKAFTRRKHTPDLAF